MAERQARLSDLPGGSNPPFLVVDGFVEHPFLAPHRVEAREYQIRLAERVLRHNTLVVLPTGLGKTVVAILVIAERLRATGGTILLLAPTRPLSLQHFESLRRLLRNPGLIHHFSGEVPPSERQARWGQSVLIVATPQTIRNDLTEGRYDLRRLSLVVFDEAHRAVGDYAYAEIGARLRQENPHARILALTASPGASRERIREIAGNLGVEAIDARDHASPDVAPYVQPAALKVVPVKLTPTLRSIQQQLQALLNEQEARLRQMGAVQGPRPYGVTKREVVQLIQRRGRPKGPGPGPPNFAVMQVAQKALYANICLEQLETQGLAPLKRYLDRLYAKAEPKRAEKSFLREPRVARVHERLSKGIESSHPKVEVLLGILREMVSKKPDALALVFTQYRDTVASLQEALAGQGIRAERLVGQQARGDAEGQSQAEQAEVLARFSRREFPVLVSTSVGEEGLDVPQVDLVVFYEAVPSEIRAVQRRGRTGRTVAGRVVVLVTEGTRDEGFLRAQTVREGRMKRLVSRFA